MNEKKAPLSKLEPLFFGRVGRVVVGIATLYWGAALWSADPGVVAGLVILLGLSFLIGGVVGNPGCEITALPNLFLSRDKRTHCV